MTAGPWRPALPFWLAALVAVAVAVLITGPGHPVPVLVGCLALGAGLVVGTVRARRVRRVFPMTGDGLTFAEQNQLGHAGDDPDRIAALSPRLRTVALANARHQVHVDDAEAPWSVPGLIVVAIVTGWSAVTADDPHWARWVVAGALVLLIGARVPRLGTPRQQRALLARFDQPADHSG